MAVRSASKAAPNQVEPVQCFLFFCLPLEPLAISPPEEAERSRQCVVCHGEMPVAYLAHLIRHKPSKVKQSAREQNLV
jgi:hypothetical protein